MTRNRIVVTLESEENIDCSPTVFRLYEERSLLGTYYSEDEVTRELERIFESLARNSNNVSSSELTAGFILELSNKVLPKYKVKGICEKAEGKREILYSIKIGLAPHKELYPEEIEENEEDNGIEFGL